MLTVANGEIFRFEMPEDSFAASPGGTWLNRLKKAGEQHIGRMMRAKPVLAKTLPLLTNFAFFCFKFKNHRSQVDRVIHSCSTTRLKFVRYSRVTLASVTGSMLDRNSYGNLGRYYPRPRLAGYNIAHQSCVRTDLSTVRHQLYARC